MIPVNNSLRLVVGQHRPFMRAIAWAFRKIGA